MSKKRTIDEVEEDTNVDKAGKPEQDLFRSWYFKTHNRIIEDQKIVRHNLQQQMPVNVETLKNLYKIHTSFSTPEEQLHRKCGDVLYRYFFSVYYYILCDIEPVFPEYGHIIKCKDEKCTSYVCVNLKRIIRVYEDCPNQGCYRCKYIDSILEVALNNVKRFWNFKKLFHNELEHLRITSFAPLFLNKD